jgi:hypothetical protein
MEMRSVSEVHGSHHGELNKKLDGGKKTLRPKGIPEQAQPISAVQATDQTELNKTTNCTKKTYHMNVFRETLQAQRQQTSQLCKMIEGRGTLLDQYA